MSISVKTVPFLFAMFLATVSSSFAAEATGGKLVLGLDDCIRRALRVAPELGEARADVELAAAKLEEAKAHRYPQIEFLGLAGPVSKARGNQVYSPDHIERIHGLTVFARGDATLVQPIYTFGKISERMKAASHGIEVDKAKNRSRRTTR